MSVTVRVTEVHAMLNALREGRLSAVQSQLESLLPKPPTGDYYILFKVTYQPDESADPDVETPPMDFTHDLTYSDTRVVAYEMEAIGEVEHINEELMRIMEERG